MHGQLWCLGGHQQRRSACGIQTSSTDVARYLDVVDGYAQDRK
ncbi:MAG: hypothetical protein ACLP50_07885 [Solirubrobacteraceae bacterium]